MVLNKEWGNGLLGLLKGTLRDYHRDPFPHSLLRTREFCLFPKSERPGLAEFRESFKPAGYRLQADEVSGAALLRKVGETTKENNREERGWYKKKENRGVGPHYRKIIRRTSKDEHFSQLYLGPCNITLIATP